MIRAVFLSSLLALSALAAQAQVKPQGEAASQRAEPARGFTALARLLPEQSEIASDDGLISLNLSLSQSVPFRVYTLSAPARLVLDFQEVDFAGTAPAGLLPKALVPKAQDAPLPLRFGVVRPGWSRLVLDLPMPQVVHRVAMRQDPATGQAGLTLRMRPASASAFAQRSGAPFDPDWALPAAPQNPKGDKPRALGGSDGRVTLVLDPGHGGIDPGATSGTISEADLMLVLAQEVRDALVRAGDFEVVLTRSSDVFVSLERRVAIARAAGADLFVSLHADALAQGKANGASVYTLSPEASDAASAALAERHNRTDLLAGVDLTGQDDEIAGILLDLARMENAPRSKSLARGIILGINKAVGHTYKRPIQSAGFSVLKAADIPSVLVEVGFLSSKDDLSKLTDPSWRAKLVEGVAQGIQAWLLTDAAEADLRRK